LSDAPGNSPVLSRLKVLAPDAFESFVEEVKSEHRVVVEKDNLKRLMGRLLNDEVLGTAVLWDLTALVPSPQSPRLEIRYSLVWPEWHYRLLVCVDLPDRAPRVDSMTGIWPSADWLEREVWDLYGVSFEGHPDLRRILLPEDFSGHPHRGEAPGLPDEPGL